MRSRRARSRLTRFQAGLLAIAVVVVGTYLGFAKDVPFINEPFHVEAVFPSANNLRSNSPVRIAGVDVGKVTSIERVRPGAEAARVVMAIEDKGLPIHRDATMKIRPRIFLEGNFFVDVQPGSPSAPVVGDGDTIPINQTSAPVQLDQVLTALQSDTREDLKVVLDEFAAGLEGDGARGFRRSQRFWEGAYRDSAIVNDAATGEKTGDLSAYIRDAGLVAAALDSEPEALKSLVTDFATVARALANEDRELTAAIDELPRTLRTAGPALAALRQALPPLRAFANDLRPGVRSSTETLEKTLPFVRQARGLVGASELRGLSADLRGVVPSLARLTERSVPLLGENRLTASCVNEVLIPWSSSTIEDADFPATGPVFEEAAKGLSGLAGESRSGDANGQWFRVLVAGGTFVTGLTNSGAMLLTDRPIQGVNPPPPTGGRSPLRADVDCETQQAPDLRSIPAPPPSQSRRAVVPSSGPGRKRYEKLLRRAVRSARKDIEARDLDIRVTTREATRDTIAAVRAAAEKVAGGGR